MEFLSSYRNPEQQTIQWKIPSLSHRSENGGKYSFLPCSYHLTFLISTSSSSSLDFKSKIFWSRYTNITCLAGVGALLGRFQMIEGPCKPSQLTVQFTSEGSTLSGCDIQLVGTGYRLSLVKKRFAAGQFKHQKQWLTVFSLWFVNINAHGHFPTIWHVLLCFTGKYLADN